MQKIASFQVNHLNLLPGLYLSRTDRREQCAASTFDLRVTAPNREPVMDVPAIHTIEHLGATFFRNSKRKDEIIYFGPMGCATGFYLILQGEWDSHQLVFPMVSLMAFIRDYKGDIPGATMKECGNYLYHDLKEAKKVAADYIDCLNNITSDNLSYPKD